jgi:hypothetical protein
MLYRFLPIIVRQNICFLPKRHVETKTHIPIIQWNVLIVFGTVIIYKINRP